MALNPTLVPPGASKLYDGTAAAPTSGSAIVTSGSSVAPAGEYEISGGYIITGAAEAAAKNIQLAANGAAIQSYPTAGQNILYTFRIPRVTLNGSSTVRLIAAANATASTVYTGWLVITQIG